jgi:cbb3-type cytochrome oxidase subunit 3
MYKNVLQSISGIEIYPIISFLIFFAFFIGLTLYVLFVDKKHVSAMSEMPLQNENQPQNKIGPLVS